MKTLTANALTEIAKLEGTEPIFLIEVSWESGVSVIYSDRTISGISGKILSIGQIESSLNQSNQQSQSLQVVLDDTDDALKTIFDTIDIHKISCTLYQYYGGLGSLSDKFVLTKGQILTPITWDEADRTVSFSVLSELESFEVGFTPEEGQLDFVSYDLIGKPWPLCFGDCLYVPAQKVHDVKFGTLGEDIGIVDPTLAWKLRRLEQSYQQEHFMLKFYGLLMKGANLIARPVADILTDYVKAIIAEDQINIMIGNVLFEIDRLKAIVKKNPGVRLLGIPIFAAALRVRQNDLNVLSGISDTQAKVKERLEGEVQLARFEYETKKQAANGQIQAFNNMQAIYAQWYEVNQEICRQQKLEKTCFLVYGGELFPQGVETEIVIDNIKFRGIFTGTRFCKTATPIGRYQNVEVDTWTPDLDNCPLEDEHNGLSVFYLKDIPAKDLTGMYLLVKNKFDTDIPATVDTPEQKYRHIIKVERQVGNKVIFELIPRNNASQGQPQGVSLDDLVGRIRQIPIIYGPMFQQIPLSLYTGDLDPQLYGRPEIAELADIVASIPQGVNSHELEVLGYLVLLKPSDLLGDDVIMFQPTPRDVYTQIGTDVELIVEASAVPLQRWFDDFLILNEEIPDTIAWKASANADVYDGSSDCEIWICNILPSTIKAVHAYRTTIDGKRILAPVPLGYYDKRENQNLGTINITALVLPRSLAKIPGENWEEPIYVSLTSSVGPNTADIIKHLIETYITGATLNGANYTAIKAKLANYPSNFALFERPNVLDEIARIAWEARCAIYRVGTEFFIKYLAETPTEDVTFTEADIETQTLSVTLSSTESLATRLIAHYNLNYLPIEQGKIPPRLILRSNVKKYGLHQQEELFHIYNIPSLVEKSATFWMIRNANTWKRVQFKTFRKNIRLDVFDTIKFNLGTPFFSTGQIKAVVEQATLNPDDDSLNITCWLPIRNGEMLEYYWAWPAGKDASATFPLDADIVKGLGGGYGPGTGVTGTIGGCP